MTLTYSLNDEPGNPIGSLLQVNPNDAEITINSTSTSLETKCKIVLISYSLWRENK